jgi:glycosyltransferase involved in cell wall biosynthesis
VIQNSGVNIELLLQSLPSISARYPRLRCALIGGGSREQKLKRMAKELGINTHIIWVGQVLLPDVAKWLGRAKVFVSPSISDGNNISLNEAMACGCFPVCTDIPANQEWLREGENGYLVPINRPDILAQRIIHALEVPEFRRQCASKNWRIIEDRADWNKNMLTMDRVYRKLLAIK